MCRRKREWCVSTKDIWPRSWLGVGMYHTDRYTTCHAWALLTHTKGWSDIRWQGRTHTSHRQLDPDTGKPVPSLIRSVSPFTQEKHTLERKKDYRGGATIPRAVTDWWARRLQPYFWRLLWPCSSEWEISTWFEPSARPLGGLGGLATRTDRARVCFSRLRQHMQAARHWPVLGGKGSPLP